MLMRPLRPRQAARRQRGLSIVEMMVGIAIGLIIVAAATLMVAGQLADNRRLLQETQIQQDLRSAADLVTRDLRRASYWKDAHLGTASAAVTGAGQINPYGAMSLPTSQDPTRASQFAYANSSRADNQTIDDDERRGFRLSNGTLQVELGRSSSGASNWQALTDPAVLNVTGFAVTTQKPQCIALACEPGDNPCPAFQQMRNLTIEISGEAVHDSSLKRSIRTQVRVRNDAIVGACAELP